MSSTLTQTDCDRSPEAGEGVLRIRGARVHNLKDVDLDIPRNQFVVLTGVSGSGKSSLAFDTIFAEGQRQYIESLSTYARQFLDQLQRPDVDLIDGLEPTLCIDQKSGSTSPRSTVATVTEIYDYLRLLMARVGTPHCYSCGAAILQQSSEQMVASLMALPEGSRLILLSPMVRGRKGVHEDVFEAIRKAGLVRVRVDSEMFEIESTPALAPRKNHTIEAVVDRLVVHDGIESRLEDSVKTACRLSNGLLIAYYETPEADDWQETLMNTRYACPDCEISYEELEPRTFSFNSPYGACAECDGLGLLEAFDLDLLIPDWSLSPAKGAITVWKDASSSIRSRFRKAIEPVITECGGDWQSPLSTIRKRDRAKLTESIEAWLEAEWERKLSDSRRAELQELIGLVACHQCDGQRLRPEPLSVTLAEQNIGQIVDMSVDKATEFFGALLAECLAESSDTRSGALSESDRLIARPILIEIDKRLRFLCDVGLTYLTLGRSADTLSGGELQRVRLATSIGSGLVGVCYVLDEPSIGLHPRDNDRLIQSLRDLQSQGNTVLVVEHDEAMMRAADWLIDLGPGAGSDGGEVLLQARPQEIDALSGEQLRSLTVDYLNGGRKIHPRPERRVAKRTNQIKIEGVSTHNLKNVDARFPLGTLIGVAGVSGSGKSSLVVDTLFPALGRHLGLKSRKPGPYRRLTGADLVDKLIRIDQSPIGRSPRSCPATYTGVFDLIRKAFAQTRDAKARGFDHSRFSFNAKSGRCEQCQGQGQEKIEMNFLSDLYVRCSVCGGRRFNRQTLAIRYKGATIADVLEMNVEQASEFFANFPKIMRILRSMHDVGLGYLYLGQPSTTLSGGEAQRIKLATELSKTDTGQTLYLLDEPTTGLHFEDVRRLINVLQSLVDKGNTVVVIEHNLDVIGCCDWVIELGPEGGEGGGRIVAQDSPVALGERGDTPTGKFLVHTDED